MTIGNTFYLSGDGTAETNSGDGIGSLYAWGPGILQNDAGNNILSGGTLGLIQNSGNAVIKVNAGSLDIQDPVALNTPFGASSRDVFFGGVSSGTIDGAITDGGYSEALSFTKVDSGSWTLTNTANSFYGFLKVANGTLAVATLNGNGLGAITLGSTTSNESATLRFIGSGTDANPITNAARPIYLAGNATIDASGAPGSLLDLLGNASISTTGALGQGVYNYNLTLTGSGAGEIDGLIENRQRIGYQEWQRPLGPRQSE